LKENDPLFAKLHSFVLYMCKKESMVKKVYQGTSYLVKSSQKKISGNLIDSYNFRLLPIWLFEESETMLSDMLKYLKNETSFSQAIPLNQLIERLKLLKHSEFEFASGTAHIHSQIVINDLVRVGLENAIVKLESAYVKKGKLNRNEAEAFKLALKDLAEDLKDGGIYPGLYEYLSAHIDNLNKEIYKERYHNCLDYLYRIIKTSIAAQLQN
ncbi:MAG: hypothetical protein ACM34K_00495, partial [Bacillota bacterium]